MLSVIKTKFPHYRHTVLLYFLLLRQTDIHMLSVTLQTLLRYTLQTYSIMLSYLFLLRHSFYVRQKYSIMLCYLLLRHSFYVTDIQYYAILSVINYVSYIVSTLQTYSNMLCYLLLRHSFYVTDIQYYVMFICY